MSCGMFDEYVENPSATKFNGEAQWVTIWVYERQTAIAEGLLIPYQFRSEGQVIEVCFTKRLYAKSGRSPRTMKQIAKTGLNMLCEPQQEDTEYLKRRTVREGKIFLVQDKSGITFMETADP